MNAIKTNIFFLLIFFVLNVSGSIIETKIDTIFWGQCNVNVLIVRDTTSKHGERIAQLYLDQKVLILSNPQNEWIEVIVKNKTGYVYGKYLDVSTECHLTQKINYIPEVIINERLLNSYIVPQIYFSGWLLFFGEELFDETFEFAEPFFLEDKLFFILMILGFFIFIVLFFVLRNKIDEDGEKMLNKIEIAFPFYCSIILGVLSILSPDMIFNLVIYTISSISLIIIDFIVSRKQKHTLLIFLRLLLIGNFIIIAGYYFVSSLLVLILYFVKIVIIVIVIGIILYLLSIMPGPPTKNEFTGLYE